MKEQYLECGRVTSTHGVRGAVMIESWCDSPEILCGVKKLWYKKKDEYIPLEVTKASVHKGRVLAQFYGIDMVEEASLLKNRVVYADREDLPVGEDRVFVADMLGLPVVDASTGNTLGVLEDYIENPANDLFSVRTPDGREVLVPVVDEFIDHVDDEKVYLSPIPGMFDDGDTDDTDDTDHADGGESEDDAL